MVEYHKAESDICRNLHNKNTRCPRNSTCSLLLGALSVCLCLLISVTRDSIGSLHGKCSLLIKYLLFPLAQYLKGTEAHKTRMTQWAPLWILITLNLVFLLWRTVCLPLTQSSNYYHSHLTKIHVKCTTVWYPIFSFLFVAWECSLEHSKCSFLYLFTWQAFVDQVLQ